MHERWKLIKCNFSNGIDVDVEGSRGGLSVQLRSYSQFHVDVNIQGEHDDNVWRFIGFYGHLEEWFHVNSWNLLRQLGQDQSIP